MTNKKQILEFIEKVLSEPDVQFYSKRAVRDTTRHNDQYESREPGRGVTITITVPLGFGESYDV